MLVSCTNTQHLFAVHYEEVEALVASTLSFMQVDCDEVSIHFVSKDDIAKLHEEYFDDPSPTDCITFPIDSQDDDTGYKVLGDVFVCPEVAYEYSQAYLTSFDEEVSLYIVHGLLHLLGFDDIEEDDRDMMRKQEKECLDHLKERNLLLSVERPKVDALLSR